MSLYNKITDKISDKITAVAVKKLMKATNKDVRYLLESGQWTEDDLDNIINESIAETNAKQHARAAQQQRASSYKCCSNCYHYRWGECWYYYENHPGFTRSEFHRADYHGETRKINDPDGSVCGGFEKKY